MNEKTVSEIIQEYDIHISSSEGGGYVAKSTKKDIVLKAKTLERLMKMIRKVYS